MRKVYLDVNVRLIINVEDGVSVDTAMSDIEHEFTSSNENVDVVDSEVTIWNVTDSK